VFGERERERGTRRQRERERDELSCLKLSYSFCQKQIEIKRALCVFRLITFLSLFSLSLFAYFSLACTHSHTHTAAQLNPAMQYLDRNSWEREREKRGLTQLHA